MSSACTSSGAREYDIRNRPGSVGWRMVTWPKASSTPSLAIMRLARATRSRASSSLDTGVSPFGIFIVLPRFAARRPVRRRQFEALEGETGRDCTTHQCPVADTFRRLPGARGHRHLWNFARGNIAAEPDDFFSCPIDHGQLERRTGVKVPDLDRVDSMPVRAFAAGEQEQDRGRGGAAVDLAGIAESLAVMPAFRVRL